ncbi:MAG: hypothetical protein JWM61_3035 [Micrococcaceae bacterium]|nr:hypothetical protein [Micrococcaceae bacterium]
MCACQPGLHRRRCALALSRHAPAIGQRYLIRSVIAAEVMTDGAVMADGAVMGLVRYEAAAVGRHLLGTRSRVNTTRGRAYGVSL